jgi:hypothetical protein
VTRQLRLGLFGVSAAGLAALLLWSVAGLPDFGHYRGPYGNVLNQVVPGERHVTNVVSAVVFDYRGIDTLGEEFILFSAAMGVALLLRDAREEEQRRPDDRAYGDALRLAWRCSCSASRSWRTVTSRRAAAFRAASSWPLRSPWSTSPAATAPTGT